MNTRSTGTCLVNRAKMSTPLVSRLTNSSEWKVPIKLLVVISYIVWILSGPKLILE